MTKSKDQTRNLLKRRFCLTGCNDFHSLTCCHISTTLGCSIFKYTEYPKFRKVLIHPFLLQYLRTYVEYPDFDKVLTPPPPAGRNGRYRDYKYIFSKFKPYYTLRMDNRNAEDWENVNYTSCLTFSDYIVAGCNNGHIKVPTI